MLRTAPLALAACAFATLFASALRAETLNLAAGLDGLQETPPTDTKGKGSLKGTYDTASRGLTFQVTYDGLTGPATAAHFHSPAPAGKAAPVSLPINGAVTSPITGSVTLTEDQAKALMGGEMYFNVHTATNKGGEIRGQVTAAK